MTNTDLYIDSRLPYSVSFCITGKDPGSGKSIYPDLSVTKLHAMMCINYSITNEQILQQPIPESYLRRLPHSYRERIFLLHQSVDRYNRLSGALLLREMAMERGFDESFLAQLKTGNYGRPYHEHAFDFSISHSHHCTVCAMSNVGQVGIDIEHYRQVEIQDFRSVFTFHEWHRITSATDRHRQFFDLWTAKEAVSKLDGRGLSFPLDQIQIDEHEALMEQKKFRLSRILIEDEYIVSIAYSAHNDPGIIMKKISFWD